MKRASGGQFLHDLRESLRKEGGLVPQYQEFANLHRWDQLESHSLQPGEGAKSAVFGLMIGEGVGGEKSTFLQKRSSSVQRCDKG